GANRLPLLESRMNAFVVKDLHGVIRCAAAAMADLERPLNDADRALGDGDTGTMLTRLLNALAAVEIDNNSPWELFTELAEIAADTTGSSLGTLIVGALIAMSEQAKSWGKVVPVSALPLLLHAAESAMIQRGKAELGDKTVVDTVNAVGLAIAG